MPRVQFTRHLQRFFPKLDSLQVQAATVAELVNAVDERFPGLGGYLVDERGALRRHVNIFIGDRLVRDRAALSDALAPDDEVTVMQALSGG